MRSFTASLISQTRCFAGSLRKGLSDLLWPGVCCHCGTHLPGNEEFLCKKCWDDFQVCTAGDYCPHCGRDASGYGLLDGQCGNCLDREIMFDSIARVGIYDGLLRNLILKFKFHDGCELAPRLGELAGASLCTAEFAHEIDYFVPVPLFWLRRFGRGYNQSELICKKLPARRAPINNDLVRIRDTQRQWNLTSSKRKKNVAGAFAVRKGHDFAGKRICLVDDIITSGATLNECAAVLKSAGAEQVHALVLAVAAQDSRTSA
ncbi:DNA utilization protein GntX [Anaerohalosphaera lusitana]|uniref:DNA utilization protein GntX n=1 Tax=Anaerohalosphaera lusitana TaxID=1936003 RepID=A0A1U9NLU1_9BACT|nr:ComF family protein [Anaerohalosphaera lusitana]AQT68550.1 DNA utilization protein GntX [Anaerohalosphaera lusitana]